VLYLNYLLTIQLIGQGETDQWWRSQEFSMRGVWFGSEDPSRLRQGVWGGETLSAGRFLQFSIKKRIFYAYLGQNRYFKAITYQLKAFE